MPQVTETDPDPAQAGKRLTIRGNRFGSKKGTVKLDVRGLTISCPVSTWHDDIVVVSLPAGLDNLLQGNEAGGLLRVGNEKGATTQRISVVPGSGARRPEIVSVPARVSPGNPFVILGEQFGKAKGKVDLVVSGKTPVSLKVTKWNESYVEAEIPTSVKWKEYLDAKVRVHVQNPAKGAAFVIVEKNAEFEPELVTRILMDFHVYKGKASKKETKTYQDFHDDLTNGWRVVASEVDFERVDNISVRWIERPKRGSTRPFSKTKLTKPKMYKQIPFQVGVVIQGPKGTKPFEE